MPLPIPWGASNRLLIQRLRRRGRCPLLRLSRTCTLWCPTVASRPSIDQKRKALEEGVVAETTHPAEEHNDIDISVSIFKAKGGLALKGRANGEAFPTIRLGTYLASFVIAL